MYICMGVFLYLFGPTIYMYVCACTYTYTFTHTHTYMCTGVAMWIEDHIERTPESIGYSGSSGGALVAGTLSSGINAQKLASFVIEKSFPVAGKNPFLLLGQCEIALDTVRVWIMMDRVLLCVSCVFFLSVSVCCDQNYMQIT
jgi:hypothetical protein